MAFGPSVSILWRKNVKNKIKHILKSISSGIVWGLGQLFNRQYYKALFFFLFFAVFMTIELGSSKYFTSFDSYSKIPGEDFSDSYAEKFYREYLADINDPSRPMQRIASFDDYYDKHGKDGFTVNELIEFTAQDISAGSPKKYYLLSEELKADSNNKGKDRSSDLIPGIDDEVIGNLKSYIRTFITYQSEENEEYLRFNRGSSLEPDIVYININNPEDIKTTTEVSTYKQLIREGNIYRNDDYSKFYIEVVTISITTKEVVRYDNILDPSDSISVDSVGSEPGKINLRKTEKILDAIYYNPDNNFVYGYFNPDGREGKYRPTVFSKYLSNYLVNSNSLYAMYDQDDFAKFKLRIYLEMHPEAKENFEKTYDNFYYDRAGFFLKGIWSIITLGQAEKAEYYQIGNLSEAINVADSPGVVASTIYVRGHLSSDLLIKGLISTFLLFFFMIFYIWGIKDAYTTSVEFEKTKQREKDKDYFKELYEKSFEYIVLSPAIFTIAFISLMPIVFGFLIAFTSYNGNAADVGLFDWVGFSNFLKIFTFGDNVGLPFGSTFWRVFVWTVIWAIFSTFTVFFGGFFQAVIINSERVPLKKFWRTLLILPWAVPAIISQMVFANFFNEVGVVNEFLKNIGLYKVLINWGWLGQTWSKFIESGLPRIFYLGTDNIQWFSNPHNPWFVRITLIVVNIWLGFPYYMALMSSVMTGIDKTLYEAADIDGATKSQKFRYVTFPLVLFSTAPLLVMCFSGNFNNFGMIYFTTQGGANKGYTTAFAGDTDILISWMYTLTVDEKYYNMASVFSILIFLIVGSITAWNYSRTRSFKED